MKILLKHYGTYTTHLEELANNDSLSEKQWNHAKYPMHLPTYLGVLSILV